MKTPTSVLILSIIGIILAAIGLLGLAITPIMFYLGTGMPNPMLDVMRHDPYYPTILIISTIVGLPIILLQLFASIASLKLKAWARRGMLIYAWAAIIQVLAATTLNVTYLFPKMFAALPAGSGSPENAAAMGGIIGGIIGGACGCILGLAFPICVLYFFTRPKVIDAFNGIFPAPVAPPPTLLPNPSPQDNSPFP